MLKSRTLFALGLLAVCAGLAIWKLTRPDPHVRTPGKAVAGPIAALPKDKIDELEIAEPGKPPVQLKKDGAAWKVVAPVADKADEQAVKAAVETLAEMKWREVVAEKPESHEKLGLDDKQAVKVTVKGGGQVLATLYLGKSTQVRVGDDPRVWATKDLRRWSLVREARLWREREIVKLEPDKIDKLTLAYAKGETVVLKKGADGKWSYAEGTKPMPPSFDAQAASDLTATLGRIDADQFVDTPVPDDQTGLATPQVTLTAQAGADKPVTLLLGKSTEQNTYVKRADGPRVWQIASYVSKRIPSSPAQWQDKALAEITPEQIVTLEVQKGADKTVLAHEGEAWKAKLPADLGDVDEQVVGMAASSFGRLRAQSVVEAPDPKLTGLATPTGTIAVTTKDGKTTRLILGAEVKAERAYYAQLEGRQQVYLVSDYLVNPALKAPKDFKAQAPAAPMQ